MRRPKSVDMVHGEVVGLKNGKLGGDCGERWRTGCQGLIGKCSDFELYSVVNKKPVEVTKSLTRLDVLDDLKT